MIEVEGLSKRYGRALAVDNISFNIEKGEVVGLLGPNGAGKTTTMKILTAFISATEGKAVLNGYDTFDSPYQVRKHVGYLPENCPLYLDMDVQSFLNYIAEIRDIDSGTRTQAVDKVISDCDLGKVRRKIIGHLSKGYRQRVGLAQALIHNPDILILDEPTSGLDPNQIRDILRLINDLGQEKTVIHSTHILTEVEATSNRVLIINNGRIVAQGTPKELMAKSAGTTVFLTVKGEGVQDKIAQSPFAKSVSEVGPGADGFQKLAVTAKNGGDVSLDLFRLAVEQNWLISELRADSAKLEDVFAKLTRGQA